MTCDELRDSFELYSLGLLEDGEEKTEVEAHLARGCSACSAAMKDALAVQTLFLAQAPEVVPPARLRRRVMSAVGAQPSMSPVWTWITAGVALGSIVLALWMNVQVRDREQDLTEAREASRVLVGERDKLQAVFKFLQEPQTRQVNFGDAAAAPPRGNVYLHPKLGVLLIATNLPPIDATKTYEMWLIPKKGGAPEPAGIFGATSISNGGGSAFHMLPQAVNLADYSTVAVSIEPAGGSASPTQVIFGTPIA